MATTLLGTPVNRVDGRKKVTGTAQYAAEITLAETTHGVLIGSSIAGGRIKRLDIGRAEKAPGVLLVMTQQNRGSLGVMPDDMMAGGLTAESRPPLDNDSIFHTGQYLALVVAERWEQARFAASLIEVEYENGPFTVDLEEARATTFQPEAFMGEPLHFSRGDVDKALDAAAVRLDQTYSTPNEHPCALEPHAVIASFSNDFLTVYNSSQWVMGDRVVLAAAFGMEPEKVRVVCPFVGGMFGSKGATGAHVILAAAASRQLNRPVKIVLTRDQVLTDVGHRTETVQHIEIGASHDGKITAMRHHVTSHTGILDDFPEPASVSTRMLYDVPNYATSHDLVRLNVMKPSWMRAPGEAPGQFALESAMDELAYHLEMDPVELRKRNHAKVNPHSGKPFSSKNLLACYDRGAERFGWSSRNPNPRSMRDEKTLIGYGMGTATYPGYLMGATVKVRLEQDGSGVKAVASTAGSDVGTGMYTMLSMTVADNLGLPLERVKIELGDTQFVPCSVAGGSNLTASTAPAASDACREIRAELLKIAGKTADGFTGAEGREDEFLFSNGRVAHRSDPGRSIGLGDLLRSGNKPFLEAQAQTTPIFGQNDKFAFQSFGAHFVEVRVQEEIGKIRVSRIVSVFDCGRILSAKTTRSQFMGGIVFGIGAALLEELTFDREHGQPSNADLAGYLVPVNADVPEMDISWIDEPDYNFNSIGCRGVGEIGITGVAAAIANAVFHATAVRIRDLPITPDKLIAG